LSPRYLKTHIEKMNTSHTIERPDGSVISFATHGEFKNPALVLSNSLATDRSMWQLVLPQLSKAYYVVTYDTRGHGLSQCAANNIELSDLANDVVAVMDAAKIQKAFFAGISLGGMTGLTLALHHPDRLLGLMACNCRGRIDAAGIEGWNQRLEVARKGGGMHALAESSIARWFAPDYIAANPEQMKIMAQIVSKNSVDGFETCDSKRPHDGRITHDKNPRPVCSWCPRYGRPASRVANDGRSSQGQQSRSARPLWSHIRNAKT
jgi:3-oxoadipate enol-lactonase